MSPDSPTAPGGAAARGIVPPDMRPSDCDAASGAVARVGGLGRPHGGRVRQEPEGRGPKAKEDRGCGGRTINLAGTPQKRKKVSKTGDLNPADKKVA